MESLISTSQPLNLSTSQPLNLSGGVSTSQPAFRLYSSTACVHSYCKLSCSSTFLCAHPYGIPALSACIPTNLQHSLHAFFCMSIACGLMWTASPLCAFLLCSSTVGVHFYCIAALFACFSIIPQYYIPALYACISVIFKHFSGCIYTRLYVKCSGSNSFKNKRHGPIRNPFDKMDCFGLLLGCWASSEHCERLDVLRTIAFLVPSISIAFLLLSISIAFLFPFLKCHLISRHHGEIYTTRSVQSDRTSNASYRFSHFGIHVPLNLYNFNPNFSLPVLLKV